MPFFLQFFLLFSPVGGASGRRQYEGKTYATMFHFPNEYNQDDSPSPMRQREKNKEKCARACICKKKVVTLHADFRNQ